MPPIYPGTTVSIPPPGPSSSSPSHPSSTAPAGPGATTMPRDGTYKVGVEIQPGTYRSDGGEYCYWERLRGLGGTSADIIANGAGTGPQEAQIAPSDVAFKTRSCGAWSLVPGGATTTSSSAGPVALPPDAHPCPTTAGPAGGFTQSAVGTSDTSCPFAEQVRLAYAASGPASPTTREITAMSPTTGKVYTLLCAAIGLYVACRGGTDAVVYVY